MKGISCSLHIVVYDVVHFICNDVNGIKHAFYETTSNKWFEMEYL